MGTSCVCVLTAGNEPPTGVLWPQAVLTITDLFCEGQLTINYQLGDKTAVLQLSYLGSCDC